MSDEDHLAGRIVGAIIACGVTLAILRFVLTPGLGLPVELGLSAVAGLVFFLWGLRAFAWVVDLLPWS